MPLNSEDMRVSASNIVARTNEMSYPAQEVGIKGILNLLAGEHV